MSKHLILYLCICFFFCGFTHSRPEEDLKQYTFKRLKSVRTEKKQALLELFAKIEKSARDAKSDQTLLKLFHAFNRDKDLLKPNADIAPGLRTGIAAYQRTISEYYVNNYIDFYDIMLVDAAGFVFYSIRKESDYRTNILTGKLSKTKLASCLRTPQEEFFVDFQYYSPADEPAAFFLNRVYKDGVFQGWIIMQYALNMLNSILVDYHELGNTGEVYIVNQDLLMLTDSRFAAESTRLKKRIDTQAARDAFHHGAGSRLITGYRGVKVFTSYEIFRYWGSAWAIIASIEEDEILTMHFKNNREYFKDRLFAYLRAMERRECAVSKAESKVIKVDIDEYARAMPGELLETRGVATCTAIAVCLPGRFAYLTHISPRDRIYGEQGLTHLLKDVMSKIQNYEIYLHEMRDVRFVVAANHGNSIMAILDELMACGIKVSQIKFMYDPEFKYADVSCRCSSGIVTVAWTPREEDRHSLIQCSADTDDLGGILKKVSGYGD